MSVIPGRTTTRAGRRRSSRSNRTPPSVPSAPVVEQQASTTGLSMTPVMKRNRLLDRIGMYAITEDPIFTSTRQAEALNPALVSTHRPLAGPMVGFDVDTGNAVSCDPHFLYAQGRITSPTVVILGDVGKGKSSLVKTVYVARQVAMGRQVAVFDRKNQQGVGEYHGVAKLCEGTTVTFSRTKGTAINLLDPRIASTSLDGDEDTRVGQDKLLLMAAEFAHGRLTSKEHHALRAAHRAAIAAAKLANRHATIRDVIEALYNPEAVAVPRPRLLTSGLVNVNDVTNWGMDLALDLERFVDGDLSGLIDGTTSEGIDWNAKLLVFDTSELDESSPALSMVMALVATFLSSVWSSTNGQRVIVVEEGYHTVGLQGAGSVSVAGILRSLVKRGRGIGLAFVTVVHHISDIPEDSDVMSLIREAEIIHTFKQSRDDDQRRAVDAFGFPTWLAPLLGSLVTGVHVLKIGAEPGQIVRHIRTPLEAGVTNTDAAMLGIGLGIRS